MRLLLTTLGNQSPQLESCHRSKSKCTHQVFVLSKPTNLSIHSETIAEMAAGQTEAVAA